MNGTANPSYLRNSQNSDYGSLSTMTPGTSSDDVHRNGTRSDGHAYTEFLSGSVPCPSCRGVGSIPKEQEGELVALIPMKDKRLKPRRTHIWVCLAVLVCVVAAGLLIFFMFPRTVLITSNKPYLQPTGPVYVNVTDKLVEFSLENSFNISNDNFFYIKITDVTMTVLYDTQVLAEVSNKKSLEVPMRGHRQYKIGINITLDKANQMGYMAASCLNSLRWAHELVMLFQFTCNYEVLGHPEQATLQTFQFVSCYSTVKPSTIKPLSTTPAPVTSTTKKPTTKTTTQSPLTRA